MNIESLVQAVYTRKSRRKYLNEPLTPLHLQKLNEFIGEMQVPFEHDVDISIHKAPQHVSYVPIKQPDYFAAFQASKSLLSEAHTGFIGELFILHAESLGVGTCWYGHYNHHNTYQIVYGTNEENAPKRIHCITLLGYVTKKATGISDRITNALFSSKKKSVEDNLHEVSLRDFPQYIRNGLELACLAPSAMNCQCWYFKVSADQGNFTVEISKPEGYRHFKWPYTDIDVGVAAAHFWLGLQNQRKDCRVRAKEENSRVVWEFIL